MAPLVSVIVPVLGDTAAVGRLLRQIPPDPAIEVLIVDGGLDAGLDRVAGLRHGTRVIRATAGRGRQMNAGAAEAAGHWLLFLHADSHLPDGWPGLLAAASPKVIGGWFRFALDDSAWQARVIERLVDWRVRTLRLPYGDQGLFVRRAVFTALGGYRELPLLEDVEFVRRLVPAGEVLELPLRLHTSSRRWRQDGWFRRSAFNVAIVALYFAGVSPYHLSRWYRRGRTA